MTSLFNLVGVCACTRVCVSYSDMPTSESAGPVTEQKEA